MAVKRSSQYDRFLSNQFSSKGDFAKEYRKTFQKHDQSKTFYISLLHSLKTALCEDDIENFKKLTNLINYISEVEDCDSLKYFYCGTNNPIISTNIVILTCKSKNLQILKFIFDNQLILENLSVDIGKHAIMPDERDENGHNAFYYALCSGIVDILEVLVKEWPNNYFTLHSEELDDVLSKPYEELKLKNILITSEVEIFVKTKLLDLRFYSDNVKKKSTCKILLQNVSERVRLVLKNIKLLDTEYFEEKEVDDRFICIAKFIAKNIHIMKHQLKSSYLMLPWEEIEFCLSTFISSLIKEQEMNLFYCSLLHKHKILRYLKDFASKLDVVVESLTHDKVEDLPALTRDSVVSDIIQENPQFKELYKTYEKVRDICSLHKISDHVNLALSVNPKERDGQLIIIRNLQVIGEYLKNTLESPKLSTATSELLLLSLPKDTRRILIGLRNSLSHAYSLHRRTEIEQSADAKFFVGVQNDVKKVGDAIAEIFHNYKMELIKSLLKEIFNSKDLNEMKKVTKVLKNIDLDQIYLVDFQRSEYKKLENLITEISNLISDKTQNEKKIFDEIIEILINLKELNVNINYIMGFASMKAFQLVLNNDDKADNYFFIGMKHRAHKVLKDISTTSDPHNIEKIAGLLIDIFYHIKPRMNPKKLDILYMKFWNVFYIIKHETKDIKWIEKFQNYIKEKCIRVPVYKQNVMTKAKYENQLTQKLATLKNILSNNSLDNDLSKNYNIFVTNKKIQALVEMLVLDIMSILGCSKNCLENNQLLFDDYAPLLIGKCLRNHLAHNNELLETLLSNPLIAIILNANKLTSENIISSDKRIGKPYVDNPMKKEIKFIQDLNIINNQERMFAALEEGNLEFFDSCVHSGADINARNIDLWTSLHFAAKGFNLEIVKVLLDQNVNTSVTDVNGQNPLHIAAAYGRKNIVEYFIKESDLSVKDVDRFGKTPLHLAAQNGHKETVEILLQNNASTFTTDLSGLLPLYYAIINDFIDVVKILLEKNESVDMYEAMGGFSPLHGAAESGHLKIVNLLLRKGANVNAKNDRNWTPLHAAARNGYPEVVKALILKGADLNARVINGCTSLHYAAEVGHNDIVDILLKNRVNCNVCNEDGDSVLHFSALHGHENVVKTLLKYNANAGAQNQSGMTPLHFAAENGSLQIVQSLIKHGSDINFRDKYGFLPLHYATKHGHDKIIDLLMKNENINGKTRDGFTPLHLAVIGGDQHIINILIENKAEVNVRTKKGLTPFYLAVMNNNVDVINLLLKCEIDINSKSDVERTPLHLAAINGQKDIVTLLIKSKAELNCKTVYNTTPLHCAALYGHKDIIDILLNYKAEINIKDTKGNTPLYTAVLAGYKDIVKTLLANGANINVKNKNNQTALLLAAKGNYPEIVELLLEHGVNDVEIKNASLLAVRCGFLEMVNILLMNKNFIQATYDQNNTLLHIAAFLGQKEMVHKLMTKGADVHALNIHKETPLYLASKSGQEEVVEILISRKASINCINDEGCTPLHVASENGHLNVVKLLLKNNEIDIKFRNYQNRTPLELAVAFGNLKVVKIIVETKQIDINSKGNDGYTLLHIAAQENRLNILKYLSDKGAYIRASNTHGSNPIHMAASAGHIDSINFFLRKGCNINETGADNRTLLHYAAMKGHLKVIKYLVAEGADINIADIHTLKPVHTAASYGFKDIVGFFTSCVNIFSAVQQNRISEVKNCIKDGCEVTSKNAKGETLLHSAARNGYNEIVSILLENRANVNNIDNKGCTPLHYATKYSHLKVVKTLLSDGAVYNPTSYAGETPLVITVDKDITDVLKLVDESFKDVANGNSKVVDIINKRDRDTVKAVMNSYNIGNRSLIVVAIDKKFPKLEELKGVLQANVLTKIKKALLMLNADKCDESLKIFNSILVKRRAILGCDNPGTLDIQTYIAEVLLKKGAYSEALQALNNIFDKQKEIFGLKHKETLSTRSKIALLLHKQGKDKEALKIYEEVCLQQKRILGPDHTDTLESQLHMALVLDKLERYDQALNVNREVYQRRHESNHPAALLAQNNIAFVLSHQQKYEEALKIYYDVLKNKKMQFGKNDSDTLRTQHNIAGVLFNLNKYNEALNAYQEVFNLRKNILGRNHPDTLTTQFDMGTIYFLQKKWNQALITYKGGFTNWKTIWGPDHPFVLDLAKKIELTELYLKVEGGAMSNDSKQFQADQYSAGSMGNIHTENMFLNNKTGNYDNRDVKSLSNFFVFDSEQFLADQYSKASIGDIDAAKRNFSNNDSRIKDKEREKSNDSEANASDNHIVDNLLNEICGKKGVDDMLEVEICDKKLEKSNESEQLQADQYAAASIGDMHGINVFLEHGAKTNDKDNTGRTMLHYAVENCQINIVTLLLEYKYHLYKADVTIINNKGETPLHNAIFKGNKVIIDILLHHVDSERLKNFINAQTFHTGTAALHIAVEAGLLDTVILLLEHGAIYNILNIEGKTPVNLSKDKKITSILELIDKLFHDVNIGNSRIISNLKELKQNEFSAVTKACNNQLRTLLQVSVMNKHRGISTEMLKLFNTHAEIFQTDICKAASRGDTEAIKIILKNGSKIDDKDTDGRTALYYAVNGGHNSSINILLHNNVDVTVVYDNGNTILHLAVSKGYIDVAEILLFHVSFLKFNDFLNAQNSAGDTALHIAARTGFAGIVYLLFDNGAVYNLKNTEGKTPADVAKDPQSIRILKLVGKLFKYGNTVFFNTTLEKFTPEEFSVLTKARNDKLFTSKEVLLLKKCEKGELNKTLFGDFMFHSMRYQRKQTRLLIEEWEAEPFSIRRYRHVWT